MTMRILLITFITVLSGVGLLSSFSQTAAIDYGVLPLSAANELSASKDKRPKPLPYPVVSASEFTIQKNGAATLREFITQIIMKSSRVILTKQRFDTLMKDEQGVILTPIPLIEHALATNFTEIRPSLVILKDFIGEQEKFVRSIPIQARNISSGRLIVGFQRLTIALLNKALAREAGAISAKEFQNYFLNYKYTADSFYNSIQQRPSIGQESPEDKPSFSLAGLLENELRFFSNLASAQGLFTPFGGKITKVDSSDCYCVGMVLTVDDVASRNKNLQLVLTYINLIFLRGYKHPQSGYYILGTYLRGAGVCLEGQYCSISHTKDGLIMTPPTGTN